MHYLMKETLVNWSKDDITHASAILDKSVGMESIQSIRAAEDASLASVV